MGRQGRTSKLNLSGRLVCCSQGSGGGLSLRESDTPGCNYTHSRYVHLRQHLIAKTGSYSSASGTQRKGTIDHDCTCVEQMVMPQVEFALQTQRFVTHVNTCSETSRGRKIKNSQHLDLRILCTTARSGRLKPPLPGGSAVLQRGCLRDLVANLRHQSAMRTTTLLLHIWTFIKIWQDGCRQSGPCLPLFGPPN